MKPIEVTIPCPNCGKDGVKALKYPAHLQGNTSRISAGAKTTYHRVEESYEINSGCEHCGKTAEELIKLALCDRLILSARQKEGIVLVPFAGSGSECVSAKKLGLDFIGFEINPDYIKIAENRLVLTS